jgi:hypothetical protein
LTCEAKPRKTYREKGWTCDGTGLVVLFRVAGGSLKGMPAVVPAELLDRAMSDPCTAQIAEIEPFHGGDHLHMVIPE